MFCDGMLDDVRGGAEGRSGVLALYESLPCMVSKRRPLVLLSGIGGGHDHSPGYFLGDPFSGSEVLGAECQFGWLDVGELDSLRRHLVAYCEGQYLVGIQDDNTLAKSRETNPGRRFAADGCVRGLCGALAELSG